MYIQLLPCTSLTVISIHKIYTSRVSTAVKDLDKVRKLLKTCKLLTNNRFLNGVYMFLFFFVDIYKQFVMLFK